MMERLSTPVCRVVPSCISVDTGDGSLLVLANGSSFLYILGSEKLVSIHFPGSVGVLHVSSFLCDGSQEPLALCSASNGVISALSIQSTLSASVQEEKKENGGDILSSLFEETSNSSASLNPSQTIDACPHTANVYCFPAKRKLSLQCAYLHNDKLIVIVKKEHFTLLEVYHASSHSRFGDHQLPMFSSSLLSMEISSSPVPSNEPTITGIPYRPALSFLCCHSSWVNGRALKALLIPTTDVFFRQLFGFELSLARSTVVLIGCHNGNILFFDVRGYCNPCSTSELHTLPNTLCCLDQPLVAIHPLHLPTYTETHEGETSLISTANAIVFVGRFGKMVLFTEAEEGNAAPQVTEFHFPGPILSSFLARDHCIVFSTTTGIYQICLESQCILKNDQNPATSSPVVPQSQFRFPAEVSVAHLSFITDVSQEPTKGLCSLAAVSIDGRVFRSRLMSCQLTGRVPERRHVSRKMKECMNAVKIMNERMVTAQSQLKKVNSALMELNEVLSTLLSMQSSESDHKLFSCTISPVSEKTGVNCFTSYAEVEVCYSGVARLQRGWTLAVTTQCTTSSRSKFITLPLAGLATGGSVQHRITLEPECASPLSFSITASVCYSTTHLQSTFAQFHKVSCTPLQLLSSSTGVSVMVATSVLDALDFIQPQNRSLLQLSPQYTQVPNLSTRHSFEVVIPQQVFGTPSDSCSRAQQCRDVLRMLLPHTITDIAFTTTDRSAQLQACNYDGSIVAFEVSDKEGRTQLNISTARASCMVEVISCTCQRVLRKSIHISAMTSLQGLFREVATVSGKLAELLAASPVLLHCKSSDTKLTDVMKKLLCIYISISELRIHTQQ